MILQQLNTYNSHRSNWLRDNSLSSSFSSSSLSFATPKSLFPITSRPSLPSTFNSSPAPRLATSYSSTLGSRMQNSSSSSSSSSSNSKKHFSSHDVNDEGIFSQNQDLPANKKCRRDKNEEPLDSTTSETSTSFTTTGHGKPRKHIQRACLECRKRHIRCDGVLPVCKKCSDNKRECTYIPSNRGGARISQRKLNARKLGQEMQVNAASAGSSSLQNATASASPLKTVVVNSSPDYVSDSPVSDSVPSLFPQKNEVPGFPTYPPSLVSVTPECIPMQTEEIISVYYSSFHVWHPILPGKEQFIQYYQDHVPDLIAVMSIIAHVLTIPKLVEPEFLTKYIQQAKDEINKAPHDFIKVQASFLLTLAAHLSLDYTTSIEMREWCSETCFKALSGIGSDMSNMQPGVLASWRTVNIEPSLLSDLLCRVFHEVFCLDTMFSVNTRLPLPEFSESNLIENVPVRDLFGSFSYKYRFQTLQMVRSIIYSLTAFGSGQVQTTSVEFQRLEGLVKMFQGILAEKYSRASSDSVVIDHGIQQATMIFNFTVILLHLPLSFIAHSKVPDVLTHFTHPHKIMPSSDSQQMVVSTKQCIHAANTIAQVMGDTSYISRTPMSSRCLALALTIHVKTYLWLSLRGQKAYAYDLYGASIKVEINTLQLLASTWIYSRESYNGICELMKEDVPELYDEFIVQQASDATAVSVEPSLTTTTAPQPPTTTTSVPSTAPDAPIMEDGDQNPYNPLDLLDTMPDQLFDLDDLF